MDNITTNQNQSWFSQTPLWGVPNIIWLGAIGAISFLLISERGK